MIRKGLDIDKIMPLLADLFPSGDYRQGNYYCYRRLCWLDLPESHYAGAYVSENKEQRRDD